MSNTDMLYKLILLYILNKVDYPMAGHQLADYLIENDLTDYFTVQQELSALIEMHYVDKLDQDGKIFYKITDEGTSSLKMFKDEKINPAIQSGIDTFLKERGHEFRSDNLTTCNYYKNRMGEYDVQCKIKEKENVLLDMTISVPTLKQAEICKENWRKNKEEIYKNIMKELL